MEYFGLASLSDLPQPELFEDTDQLEEETQLLFEKLGDQLTFEEVEPDTEV
ncbi:hypothetical protein D1872_261630 [compost metagenome]